MSIVITGASGRLGRLIIKELLHHVLPNQIVACVRQMDSAAALEEQGIAVRYCDYDEPASLKGHSPALLACCSFLAPTPMTPFVCGSMPMWLKLQKSERRPYFIHRLCLS